MALSIQQASPLAALARELPNPDPKLFVLINKLCSDLATLQRNPHDINYSAENVIAELFPNNSAPQPCEEARDDNHDQIAANWSLKVLSETKRTAALFAATIKAVKDLETTVPAGEPITVHDLGCGATGILGLFAALCSSRIKVESVEYFPLGAEYARGVLSRQIDSSRFQVTVGDATKIIPGSTPRIIFSETVGHAGLHEHYPQIAAHCRELWKNSYPPPILIPAAIEYRSGVLLKDVVTGQSKVASTSQLQKTFNPYTFDQTTKISLDISLPLHVPTIKGDLLVQCELALYKETRLEEGDSSITKPLKVGEIRCNEFGRWEYRSINDTEWKCADAKLTVDLVVGGTEREIEIRSV